MFRLFYLVGIGFLVLLLTGAVNYFFISYHHRAQLYTRVEALPYRQVGLLLGTNKYLPSGKINQYYQLRIQAAVELYHAHKVDYLIVSGDNRRNSYNEPRQMKRDLIKAGIPAKHIQPDYAGFRTLDSVLRASVVFGQKHYTIISQRFHNERALFLAWAKGQTPIAFNAKNPTTQGMRRVISREFFARIKALLDVLSNKQAKFYGPPITFPEPPSVQQKELI